MRGIRESPDKNFLCFDWDDSDPIMLFGSFDYTSKSQMLDFNVMPCNAKHTEIDKQGVFTVGDECVKDH